jgi:diguanylate cyclase (GGDEF)-like protein
VMNRKIQSAGPSDRDFSGVVTQFLISYLQSDASGETLERVLLSAGETRSVAELSEASTWSTYTQLRRLLEATGNELGGPATLSVVGQHALDSIQSPELLESLSALGSPTAVYAALPKDIGSIALPTQLEIAFTGSSECDISLRFKEGYEPFPEYCAFQIGMYAAVPKLFGNQCAEIVIDSCQSDGADFCRARLRWESTDDDATRASRSELASRLSQARLEELQHTVAELVSGDGIEMVLTRVMAAAGRAVIALSFVLDIKASPMSERWLRTEGIDAIEGAQIIAQCQKMEASDPLRHICIAEVASDRSHYGRLIAVRSETGSFSPLERSVLESYARLAASALDSQATLADARQQATTAEALLALSSSLADLGSTEEMLRRLAHAIPSVINCDRVAIWLIEPGSEAARAAATFGFDHCAQSELQGLVIPDIPTDRIASRLYRHNFEGRPTAFTHSLLAAGSLAAVSFPIIYENEMYGWITVDVLDHPERLDDNTESRFRGLAGQAALAVRNARLLDEIRHRALHDNLTGLPNRTLVLDRVNQALSRARREHADVAVLFIDLDGFKDINDTLGHAKGDVLLQAVAARLTGTLREPDTVARLGGDEFVVLAEGLALAEGPELIAERLLSVLAEPFHLDASSQQPVSVSASIGIAAGARDTAEALLRDADIALYAAKDAGKNCFAVFEDEMQIALSARHELEKDLHAAVGTDQFFLLYQPIFDLEDMAVVGVEALLRWHHPVRGLLQPKEFIPALDDSGLIIPVGRWVLREACRQAMAWRETGRFTRMSVNASARQFAADCLIADVGSALAMSGLAPGDLVIEVAETSILGNKEWAQRQIMALKSLGVRIAIDDFGIGISSLAYLQQFPIDSLKIDRTFIEKMGKSPEGDVFIHTLMQLGKALHLETLAEVIEESPQLSQLQVESCDVGHGFPFARPLPPNEVAAYLKQVDEPSELS